MSGTSGKLTWPEKRFHLATERAMGLENHYLLLCLITGRLSWYHTKQPISLHNFKVILETKMKHCASQSPGLTFSLIFSLNNRQLLGKEQ